MTNSFVTPSHIFTSTRFLSKAECLFEDIPNSLNGSTTGNLLHTNLKFLVLVKLTFVPLHSFWNFLE